MYTIECMHLELHVRGDCKRSNAIARDCTQTHRVEQPCTHYVLGWLIATVKVYTGTRYPNS